MSRNLIYILLITTLCILAGCNNSLCKADNCHNTCEEGFRYCKNHKCISEGCIYNKGLGQYCEDHTCIVNSCMEAHLPDGDYCAKHTCVNPECLNEISCEKFCEEHAYKQALDYFRNDDDDKALKLLKKLPKEYESVDDLLTSYDKIKPFLGEWEHVVAYPQNGTFFKYKLLIYRDMNWNESEFEMRILRYHTSIDDKRRAGGTVTDRKYVLNGTDIYTITDYSASVSNKKYKLLTENMIIEESVNGSEIAFQKTENLSELYLWYQ